MALAPQRNSYGWFTRGGSWPWVLGSTTPKCPECEAADLERLMSLSAVSSDGTRKRNLEDGRKKAQKTQDEKAHAEHEAIHHHHH